MDIPIYIPYIEKYTKSAIDAINSTWISNYGRFIDDSGELLKKRLGIKYCILMNNGTASTHCLFIALKYKYPKIHKIYVPNNVFIAAINTCLIEYNIENLEIMKMDHNTLNIDTSEEYIKTLEQHSGVLIVHNIGNIVNVPRLKRLRPDLIFIEDNCEGLFGKYENKLSGSECLCSSVSFYANKTLTTGEGGAFFTNDEDIYNYIKSSYSHGMTEERYIHDKIAYNYRMTNIQAAFLYDQLLDLDHIIKLKKNVFNYYDKLLHELFENNTIKKIIQEPNIEVSYWMYLIIFEDNICYKKIEEYMNNNLIEVRPIFYDLHTHKHLKTLKNIYNTQQITCDKGIILPSFPGLSNKQQEKICGCFNNFINDFKQ